MCRRFQGGLRYELQDAVEPLGIQQFQVLVEKCQEIEDMRNKRVNLQGGFSAGGPSRPSRQSQNRGGRGTRPYNRPQSNRGSHNSGNQGTQGNQNRGKQTCF
ncbi:gag polyprotein, partial [Trifolium medium]|nr:gag polyprotein [Trifolium medium]